MNELLKEFLSYILEAKPERKPGESTEYPGYFRISGINYSTTAGGPITHRIENGKMITIKGKKQPAGGKGKAGKKQPVGGKGRAGKKPPSKQPKGATRTPSEPGKRELDQYKTFPSGVNVYDTPVVTPDGNKVLASISAETTKELLDKVRQEIDRKVVADDRVPDMSTKEVETYRSQEIQGPDGKPESHEQFKARMKTSGVELADPPRTIPDTVRETLRKSGVPERHIQLIERSMNVVRKGDKPPLSLIVNGSVGAGTNQSQTGEVLTLALTAVRPEERASVIAALTTPPPPRRQKGEPASPKTPDTILNNSWVESAAAQSQAFTSMMDREHGPGNWQVETTAWDTPGDISGIGLTQETKGFSTDGVVRIKVNGESRVVRLSMKKDGEVYLLNGAANDVTKYALQTLTTEERTRHEELSSARRILATGNKDEKVAAREKLKSLGIKGKNAKDLLIASTEELKNIEDTAISRLPENTQRAIRTIQDYPDKQQQSSVGLGQSITTAEGTPTDEELAAVGFDKKGDAEFARDAHRRLSSLQCEGTCTEAEMKAALQEEPPPKGGLIGGDSDTFRKAMLFAARVEAQRGTPEDKAKKQEALTAHMEITKAAKKAYIESIIGSSGDTASEQSSAMLSGLMLSLEEKFPLGVVASGTESMVVGGVPIDRATCVELFGTDDPQKIQMTLVERDGQTYLIASVGEGDGIPLAVVDVRERGEGYRGNMTVGYQMAPEFECRAAAANAAIIERRRNENPEFKTDTTANDAIVSRCGSKK